MPIVTITRSLNSHRSNNTKAARVRQDVGVSDFACSEIEADHRRIAHDLRAPLHALSGFLDLAIDDNTDPDIEGLLHAARRAATELDAQIATLDGAGDPETLTDLTDLAESIIELVRPLANDHPIVLLGGPGPVVRTRIRALRRIVINLMTNALRHSAAGTTVTITVANDPPRISINDDGPGPAAILEGGTDGNRLGLIIVRELLERLEGHLTVEAGEAKGSRVTVVLPAAPVDQEEVCET